MTKEQISRFHVARATVRNLNPKEVLSVRDYDRLKEQMDKQVRTFIEDRKVMGKIGAIPLDSITGIFYNADITVSYLPFLGAAGASLERSITITYSEVFGWD